MNKQKYLKECFDYNPESGKLHWKERPRAHFHYKTAWKLWNSRFSGKEAFARKDQHGWNFDSLDHCWIYAHHTIFTLMTGKVAKKVFHLDGDRSNNRANNLSDVNGNVPKPNEYVVVYNSALKNWNVQKNIYSAYNDKMSTELVYEFSRKKDAIAYKNNRERDESNDTSG